MQQYVYHLKWRISSRTYFRNLKLKEVANPLDARHPMPTHSASVTKENLREFAEYFFPECHSTEVKKTQL